MTRVFYLNVPQIRTLLTIVLAVAFTFPTFAQEPDIDKGKSLFNMNCAACHKLNKRAVGPALAGVSQKYEKEWLYAWIKNSMAMVKSGDPQAVAIYEEYNKSVMTAFPQLSNEDIDNILPEMSKGPVNIESLIDEQHYTQPPPRYSEASLVKKLEELGTLKIGLLLLMKC